MVFAYWSDFLHILHPCSYRHCFDSFWDSSHLELCEILKYIYDVPNLVRDDPPLQYCLIFIILIGTCVPVLMGHNSASTSSASFCWMLPIYFFDAGSFTNIDTYVTHDLSFFFFIWQSGFWSTTWSPVLSTMGSFASAISNSLIVLLLLFPVSFSWFVLVLVDFYPFY